MTSDAADAHRLLTPRLEIDAMETVAHAYQETSSLEQLDVTVIPPNLRR